MTMPAHRVFYSRRVFNAVLSVLFVGAFFMLIATERCAASTAETNHVVTVDDVITMTRIGDSDYNEGPAADGAVAHFSPDRRHFVVLVKKGNLANNTNEYSILLWNVSPTLQYSAPEKLQTMASSSNREAITAVEWLDNHTLTFVGERPGELRQVYTFSLMTRKLHQVTHHSTSVLSFAIQREAARIVFIAEAPQTQVRTREVEEHGLHVTDQLLPDLVSGTFDNYAAPNELFVQERGSSTRQLAITDKLSFLATGSRPFLSPNGKFAIVLAMASSSPASWAEYSDRDMQRLMRENLPPGTARYLYRYTLINVDDGTSRPLLNAPQGPLGSECSWSPDGSSVVVTGMYLPLEGVDADERKARQSSTFVVQVKIPSLDIIEVTPQNLRLVRWDSKTNDIILSHRELDGHHTGSIAFRKDHGAWKESKSGEEDGPPLDIEVQEDLNNPPMLAVTNAKTGMKSTLLELTPEFHQIRFGRVEALEWKSADGRRATGRIYYPPDYTAGRRYPLVIQTHGFQGTRWWVDGPWPSVFAAQPLAARGMVVLQVIENFDVVSTPQEGPIQTAVYEGAIEDLDRKGLIDRSKVGLIGFSRTCFYVKYALTHSKYRFASAVVADGIDAGYFQYIAVSNALPSFAAGMDELNAGPPFGQSLSSWRELAPGFLLDRVQTPVMIQAFHPISLVQEWEWFAALSRLKKPVDMVYLPDAVHALVKPWERKASLQNAVDWLCFWLTGEQSDPDPSIAQQYRRWRELRKLQDKNKAAGDKSLAPMN
jgi:dipeptidyl aminopeptidase/acylaminoacyl peptidase